MPPEVLDDAPLPKARRADPHPLVPPTAPKRSAPKTLPDPETIEPGRKRRISREREPIGARLDLHGMTQDQARAVLHGFIERAHERGDRAVLIITGKGVQGDGILRRRTPEWLAEPPSRARVAGYSAAERHHGGEGALYVALKRRGR
jgi:DNA-nicking Smr family endonuclease